MTLDLVLLILRGVMAALLYAFLIGVLWILRGDLRAAAHTRATRERRYGRLVVLAVADAEAPTTAAESPQGEPAAPHIGASFPLMPVTSIGRGLTNTITLTDDYASTEHALLIHRAGQWWLEDQHSRNGTLLNGAPVQAPVVVSAGDVIGVGRVQLKLELE